MAWRYSTMNQVMALDRREFLKAAGAGAAVASGLVLGVPALADTTAPEVTTNIADFLKVPRTAHSLPGRFPGKVVKVRDVDSLVGDKVDGKVVREMFERGVRTLTDTSMKAAFTMLFSRDDVVGLKVNPVGAPLISTRLELVDAVRSLGPGIQARAGILTGEAAVTIGATNQGIVAGDLVNTASNRLKKGGNLSQIPLFIFFPGNPNNEQYPNILWKVNRSFQEKRVSLRVG
jgi:hypothetical protein